MKKTGKRKKIKGFTLVEVMTSLVIMTILIAIASGVIIVTFDIFARSSLRRAAQNNGNNVYNYLYDHLSYATSLKIDRSVDINDKESIESLMTELGYSDMEDVITDYLNDDGTIARTDLKPYYEKITIDKQHMTVKRKDINEAIYIYGNAENTNTMNGCDCIVSFDEYAAADTIGFTVTIKRDGEVFYEKHGNVPILNDELKSHISVHTISDEYADLEIFYTYIW